MRTTNLRYQQGWICPDPTWPGPTTTTSGGNDNWAIDRARGDNVIANLWPDVSGAARQNRDFLRRAATAPGQAGIHQFLDLAQAFPQTTSSSRRCWVNCPNDGYLSRAWCMHRTGDQTGSAPARTTSSGRFSCAPPSLPHQQKSAVLPCWPGRPAHGVPQPGSRSPAGGGSEHEVSTEDTAYNIGCGIVWSIVWSIIGTTRPDARPGLLLLFAGSCWGGLDDHRPLPHRHRRARPRDLLS